MCVSLCCVVVAASSKVDFFFPGPFSSRPPGAIVYCKRSSRGHPCPAGRRSPSAEQSQRTVRLPWFCSWPTSPWTGSPTPRPAPGPRWPRPPSRSPGPPCSPPGWRGPSRTWGQKQKRCWGAVMEWSVCFRAFTVKQAITLSELGNNDTRLMLQKVLIALLHEPLLFARGNPLVNDIISLSVIFTLY